jgi:hypothetical protein
MSTSRFLGMTFGELPSVFIEVPDYPTTHNAQYNTTGVMEMNPIHSSFIGKQAASHCPSLSSEPVCVPFRRLGAGLGKPEAITPNEPETAAPAEEERVERTGVLADAAGQPVEQRGGRRIRLDTNRPSLTNDRGTDSDKLQHLRRNLELMFAEGMEKVSS